jgi:putative DNA primase/helicase
MIEAITAVDPPTTRNIPNALTERPQWVCWRLEERDGKLAKVPYTDTGWKASTTDLMTWTRCAMAYAAYERGDCDGIGFVFSSADPFCGIDIDDCRDPETGEIEPWAKEILDRVQGGYVEVSPSGTGVHIIVCGHVRAGGVRKGKVEMYARERFFTITGRIL